jgi:hypothetical protein
MDDYMEKPFSFDNLDNDPVITGRINTGLSLADKQRNVDEMNDLIRQRREHAQRAQPLSQWRGQQTQKRQLYNQGQQPYQGRQYNQGQQPYQGRQYNQGQPITIANYGPKYLTHPGGQFPLLNPGTRLDAWGAPDVVPSLYPDTTRVPANRNMDQFNQPYNYNGEPFNARRGSNINPNPPPQNWLQSNFGEPSSAPPLYPTDLNYSQSPTNSFFGKISSLWKGGKRTKKRRGGKKTKKNKPKKSRKH